jgi:hypothetical protein
MIHITRLLLPVTFVVSGCYRSIPITTAEPIERQRISAALSERATVDLRDQIGPDVVRVDGQVAWVRSDSVQLLLERVQQRNGFAIDWRGEPVTFGRRDLGGLMQRHLDRPRSWLAAGTITAIAIALGLVIRDGIVSDDGKSPPPVPPH